MQAWWLPTRGEVPYHGTAAVPSRIPRGSLPARQRDAASPPMSMPVNVYYAEGTVNAPSVVEEQAVVQGTSKDDTEAPLVTGRSVPGRSRQGEVSQGAK